MINLQNKVDVVKIKVFAHTDLSGGDYSLDCALGLCCSHYSHVLSAIQKSCPPVGDNFGNTDKRLFWEPLKISDIKWNFEKFLVGPDGKPVMRWHPSVNISLVRVEIHRYLLQRYTQDFFN